MKPKPKPTPTAPPPVMSIKSPSWIRYLPKVQKDKDGRWEISSPYLWELFARKNTGDSGEER